jgi:hypothetical protein
MADIYLTQTQMALIQAAVHARPPGVTSRNRCDVLEIAATTAGVK